ncbi:hypothetical protein WA026_007704 [Henosepilachna vigintioctopunctata]|uniref:Leucine-rich repeat domain-containing protein n=1 Tax=Henosepilachna vigintioctopunctata TaxID=420089 RepID=A0AAW1U2W6_9CUCU
MFFPSVLMIIILTVAHIISREVPKDLEHIKVLRENGPLTEESLGIPFDTIGTLEIRLSKIEKLSRETLGQFKNLENLTISFSKIEKVDKDVFSNCCPKLKHLEINHWPDFNYEDLKGIATLPLESLEIIDSDIPKLKSGVFEGAKLKSLVLTKNKLNEIEPDAFKGLGELEYLLISNNKIKEIPKQSLAPLRSLETLELVSNGIEKFSTDSLPELPNLTDIVFIRENLKEINFEGVHKVAPKLNDVFVIGKNMVHIPKVSGPLRIHKWL